jgi:hypothetical protein
MQVTTMGIDLAKNVFQVHGVDASGKVVVRKALRRSQLLSFFEDLAPCLIGMEACSSGHWAGGNNRRTGRYRVRLSRWKPLPAAMPADHYASRLVRPLKFGYCRAARVVRRSALCSSKIRVILGHPAELTGY